MNTSVEKHIGRVVVKQCVTHFDHLTAIKKDKYMISKSNIFELEIILLLIQDG